MIQTEKDISLLIIIPFAYPKSEPEIYCLTEFCSPHICDGRNLLNDVIKKPWQRKVHTVDFVINKLPGFFLSFNEMRKKNKNLIVGKFILNKLYMINRLKELPIYFHLVTHKEKKSALSFKSVKTHKIITISQISFCMYELDNSHSGYCKLVFFADLKDLINTKVDTKNESIEIRWKNPENDKKIHKIDIISPNCENINKILFDNQKKFLSLNSDNNKDANKKVENKENKDKENKDNIKENEKKEGKDLSKNSSNDNENKNESDKNKVNDEIKNESKKDSKEENKDNKNKQVSNINIIMVEKQIIYVEKALNIGDKPNKEQVNYLMKLYQNALTYYSATNSDKQHIIKSKINKLQESINSLLMNIEKNEEEEEEDDSKKTKNEEINIENKEEKKEIKNEIKEKKNLENKEEKNIPDIKKEEKKDGKNDDKKIDEIKKERKEEKKEENKNENGNNLINYVVGATVMLDNQGNAATTDVTGAFKENKNENVFDFLSFDNNSNQTKDENKQNNNNFNLLDFGFDFTNSFNNVPNKSQNEKESSMNENKNKNDANNIKNDIKTEKQHEEKVEKKAIENNINIKENNLSKNGNIKKANNENKENTLMNLLDNFDFSVANTNTIGTINNEDKNINIQKNEKKIFEEKKEEIGKLNQTKNDINKKVQKEISIKDKNEKPQKIDEKNGDGNSNIKKNLNSEINNNNSDKEKNKNVKANEKAPKEENKPTITNEEKKEKNNETKKEIEIPAKNKEITKLDIKKENEVKEKEKEVKKVEKEVEKMEDKKESTEEKVGLHLKMVNEGEEIGTLDVEDDEEEEEEEDGEEEKK